MSEKTSNNSNLQNVPKAVENKLTKSEEVTKNQDVPIWQRYDISYFSVFLLTYLHVAGLYGGYLCFSQAKWQTLLFTAGWLVTSLGIAVGSHRLWAHRAFSASRGLEVFLMLGQSMAMQFTVYKWVAIHRQHHRYSDSPRDPHDSSRGLFYSHIGWLMVRRPGGDWDSSTIASMDDIKANPVLEFQRRHASCFLPTLALLLPNCLPLLWAEELWTSWHCNLLRLAINLNMALTVNSISHAWGYRPYDRTLKAYQSWIIIFITLGEGHHNFHHAFPRDYRACEENQRWSNFMSLFIDVCAKLKLATDLRVASTEAVQRKKKKIGDGSRFGKNVLEHYGIIH